MQAIYSVYGPSALPMSALWASFLKLRWLDVMPCIMQGCCISGTNQKLYIIWCCDPTSWYWIYVSHVNHWNTLQGAWLIKQLEAGVLEDLAKCDIAKSQNTLTFCNFTLWDRSAWGPCKVWNCKMSKYSDFCNLKVSIRQNPESFPASKLERNKPTLAASVRWQLPLMLFVSDMVAATSIQKQLMLSCFC